MTKTLDEHYGYLSDRVKLDQYQAAIEKLVRSEHVVLDLGCGTGLLGLMALRAGARKVCFVEEGAVIEVARRTVTEAGFANKAEFFRANSFELDLPEKVDVVLCDHVGYFGFDYGVLRLLADARQRFLKPGGIIVPADIDLQLAPIGSIDCRKFVSRWSDGGVPDEFGWIGSNAANTKHSARLTQQDLLADAATLVTLELGDDTAPYLSWNAEFNCARDGTLDGVAGWFDCRLFDDIRMTNSPLAETALKRQQAFLPLEEPLSVSAGERINVTVMIRHVDDIIGWIVELPDSGKRFAHTTFNGLLLDGEALMRVRPDRIAKLNARGRARQIVLPYCDGQRTVEEVQALVLRDHPELFPSSQALSSFVRQVLASDTSE